MKSTNYLQVLSKLTFIALAMAYGPHVYGANTLKGHTADGCTYSVIDGVYTTQCPNGTVKDKVRTKASAATEATAPADDPIITDYDSVPVRKNSRASKPKLQGGAAQPITTVAIPTPDQSIEPTLAAEKTYQAEREDRLARHLDDTYVAATVGSTNVHANGAGSAMWAPLSIKPWMPN